MPDNQSPIIETLQKMYATKQFYPCLSYIRFPAYKRFATDSKITFNFPVTALVGPNGSNKSSALRAIYSCPEKQSLSTFWFSTHLDTITSGTNAFVYGYFNDEAQQVVEVVKTRVNKMLNGHLMADYWEPTKPKIKYGMQPFKFKSGMKGCSKTRWNTIKKRVLYLDFRHDAISAYDKFFYYGKLNKRKTILTKQDFIRQRSVYLNKVIKSQLNKFKFHKKDRLDSQYNLSKPLVDQISKILDKRYAEIKIIKHSFFTDEIATTILLKTQDLSVNYTEAFAGSGEYAVISLVDQISQADDKSLILLDEPEVSIHPGAQERLVEFLLESAKVNKHQIVFTTHSPAMLSHLPKEAIHVLYQDSQEYTRILSNIHRNQAFIQIGWNPHKKTIVVEDTTAADLLQHILDQTNLTQVFIIQIFPGGAESIKTKLIVQHALLNDKNFIYYLDGDKRKQHIDPKTIPPAEYDKLDQMIKLTTGSEISIPCNGRHGQVDQKQKQESQLNFLAFYRKHVSYIPGNIPEDIIWDTMDTSGKKGIQNSDTKTCFEELTKSMLPNNDAISIRTIKQLFIKQIDVNKNEACKTIIETLKLFLDTESVIN